MHPPIRIANVVSSYAGLLLALIQLNQAKPLAAGAFQSTFPEKTMDKPTNPLLIASLAALAFCAGVANAATTYVNTTVQGALAPGVYGRIDIGNAPPPPVIYTQPVIIQRAPMVVQQPPLYLHVPPGHAKKWSKHCAKYNACNQPVYFVRVRGDDDYERRGKGKRQDEYRRYEDDRGDRDDDGDKHDKGRGKKHGKGHDKG